MGGTEVVVIIGALLAAAFGGQAQSPAPAGVLAVRETAWRAYFAGDVATLDRLLPDDFIGIGMEAGPFASKAETLAGARRFAESGGRLVRLSFAETRAQQDGNVVVLYGRFEAVLAGPEGERRLAGRLTEMFVLRGGRWLHPGWHLDLVGDVSEPGR